jgi:glycine/D-amino acid oxidase-like deaminating enzyme/nitrite reductase/ring-hydroxylating ferredoxin subunit
MNAEEERSHSLWMDVPTPSLPKLDRNLETDALIIGAGITGLLSAYALQRAGRTVTVVDRGRVGRGMTARTTAHLAFELDDFFHELIKAHGKASAQAWYQSQAAAVDLIENICREEQIACDFARVDGMLMAAEEEDVRYLKKELEAAREAGFADAQWIERREVPGQEYPAIRFPRQARFHPMKFLNGLVAALRKGEAQLYEHTGITTLEERHGTVAAMTSTGHTLWARQVLVATNSPFHLRVPVHTKQSPYRTYAIAAHIPKGEAADVLLWDTVEPGYHYVRLQPGEETDLLIVGGEDHKSGTADDGEDRIARLEAWTRERWPSLGPLAYRWSGQVNEPADYVGFIGRSPRYKEVYLATGDSGQGMTTGGVAALMLRDLMNGRTSPWAKLYSPTRKMHHGVASYFKENLEAARHWIELVGPGEVASVADIPAGQGAIVKMKRKPVAAYRDESGELHLRSAVCTHAGCTVHWNGFEGCWDCPCHGSQFSTTGEVLAGPAAKPLRETSEIQDEAPRTSTKRRQRQDEARRSAPHDTQR